MATIIHMGKIFNASCVWVKVNNNNNNITIKTASKTIIIFVCNWKIFAQ